MSYSLGKTVNTKKLDDVSVIINIAKKDVRNGNLNSANKNMSNAINIFPKKPDNVDEASFKKKLEKIQNDIVTTSKQTSTIQNTSVLNPKLDEIVDTLGILDKAVNKRKDNLNNAENKNLDLINSLTYKVKAVAEKSVQTGFLADKWKNLNNNSNNKAKDDEQEANPLSPKRVRKTTITEGKDFEFDTTIFDTKTTSKEGEKNNPNIGNRLVANILSAGGSVVTTGVKSMEGIYDVAATITGAIVSPFTGLVDSIFGTNWTEEYWKINKSNIEKDVTGELMDGYYNNDYITKNADKEWQKDGILTKTASAATEFAGWITIPGVMAAASTGQEAEKNFSAISDDNINLGSVTTAIVKTGVSAVYNIVKRKIMGEFSSAAKTLTYGDTSGAIGVVKDVMALAGFDTLVNSVSSGKTIDERIEDTFINMTAAGAIAMLPIAAEWTKAWYKASEEQIKEIINDAKETIKHVTKKTFQMTTSTLTGTVPSGGSTAQPTITRKTITRADGSTYTQTYYNGMLPAEYNAYKTPGAEQFTTAQIEDQVNKNIRILPYNLYDDKGNVVLQKGTVLQNGFSFAGQGAKSEFRNAERYSEQDWWGYPDELSHCAWVATDANGRLIEVHNVENVGECQIGSFKIKGFARQYLYTDASGNPVYSKEKINNMNDWVRANEARIKDKKIMDMAAMR